MEGKGGQGHAVRVINDDSSLKKAFFFRSLPFSSRKKVKKTKTAKRTEVDSGSLFGEKQQQQRQQLLHAAAIAFSSRIAAAPFFKHCSETFPTRQAESLFL